MATILLLLNQPIYGTNYITWEFGFLLQSVLSPRMLQLRQMEGFQTYIIQTFPQICSSAGELVFQILTEQALTRWPQLPVSICFECRISPRSKLTLPDFKRAPSTIYHAAVLLWPAICHISPSPQDPIVACACIHMCLIWRLFPEYGSLSQGFFLSFFLICCFSWLALVISKATAVGWGLARGIGNLSTNSVTGG